MKKEILPLLFGWGIKKTSWFAMVCFCLAGFFSQARAGDGGIEKISYARLSGLTSTSSSSPLVVSATADLTYASEGEVSKRIRNIITLSVIEETPFYIPSDFTASVEVRIEYGPSSSSFEQTDQTLTVTFDKDEGAKYNAKHYFSFEGAEYVKITVLSITAPVLGSLDTRKVLLLQNEMRVTRYFELGTNVLPTSFASTGSTADALAVAWTWPSTAGNNHTQLEWTWLENELRGNYMVAGSFSFDLLFRNNATRVDLPVSKSSYNIPLFYDGEGKLYYRIRAVNIKTSSRSDGPWSAIDSFSFAGHEDSLNWQVRTSFAEEGKLKTVMEYYDGSLRSRQVVTKENISNTTISAETFYDAQGRPAIQILPTPGIGTVIAYTKNLNLFNGQSANQDPLNYFDLEPISTPGSATPAMATTTGSSLYYSSSNPELGAGPNKDIPDAEGYPYTVTRYTPDATGRVMAQSGVGAAMKMGSGREAKYYYGNAAQEELNGLFGTEVGNKTHYFKNMVKDANGQMSVSYVDMHGRTIATALAGDAPNNLDNLDRHNPAHYPNQGGSNITRNLLDNNTNIVNGNSIEAVNTLLVPATGDYTFRYKLNPETLVLPGCSTELCYDCMYNLEISITDESGDQAPIVRKYNNISLTPDDDCSTTILRFGDEATGALGNTIQFTESLLPGSYIVRKTLTLSEASLQQYRDMYKTLGKGFCKTEQELIDSIYNVLVTVTGCGTPVPAATCEECLESLGTYTAFRTAYLASVGDPDPVPAELEAQIQSYYDAAVQRCALLCNTTSPVLSSRRQLMLADMMPFGGQYATIDPPSDDNGTGMYEKYNIFSTAYNPFTQPYYKKPWDSDKQLDYYYNAYNLPDETIHPGGASYDLLEATSRDQFAQLFAYSWANALLPHHPEYDRLVFAETHLGDSYSWIHTFSSVQTYAQASAAGYILTTGTTTHTPYNDPFYAIAPTSYKNDMEGWVASDYRSGLSMWQIAYGSVKCNAIPDPVLQGQCYTNAPKLPPYSDLATAEKDQAWKVFRGLYAAERDNQVSDYIAANVPLADAADLVSQGYLLRFGTHAQTAAQSGWTWYPSTPGGSPDPLPDSVLQPFSGESRCHSYIEQWRRSLLQCDSLARHPLKDEIADEIVAGMEAVCLKGADAANPYGSSTVAPGTPVDGSPRSFEEVIDAVLAAYHIPRDYYCNPYVIEFPKPYGLGPAFYNQAATAVVDSCHCARFAQVMTEAAAASVDTSDLNEVNPWLLSHYGDTLTTGLWQGLQHCGQVRTGINCYAGYDTVSFICGGTSPCLALEPGERYPSCPEGYHWDAGEQACVVNNTEEGEWCMDFCPYTICDTLLPYYPLPVPEPLPPFLSCTYSGAACLDCAGLSGLTAEFKTQFSAPYNAGPVFTGSGLGGDALAANILFARFINYRTGFQYSWTEYAQAAAHASPACDLAAYASNSSAGQNVICPDPHPLTDTTGVLAADSLCHATYVVAVTLAQNIYQQQQQWLLANFEAAYRAKCMAAKNLEQFRVNYDNSEYHYTLYYYDLAGNLVKTVPPAGARPDFSFGFVGDVDIARAAGTTLAPGHELVTDYRYNSLNQPVAQQSPDGGTSQFWYDKLGRLVVSQNEKQEADDKYSYTLYDELGRITEVGQKPQATPMTQAISQDPEDLAGWILTTGGTREQLTFTQYDLPYGPGLSPLLDQRNLRNRVSFTATKKLVTDVLHYTASFYTYDVHGNVDTLLQDYKGVTEMDATSNRFKLIAYDYDLISGKVNGLSYQPGKADAFYHHYEYDAENRLTEAWTSRDSIVWERDAAYNYYKYGPLNRTELGHLRVQGMDYAYTLHGWLKGVNSTNLDPATDMGGDGTGSSVVARDILGFALHYYDDAQDETDYKAIGGVSAFARMKKDMATSLYNGNIAGISLNNAGLLKGNSTTTNALPLFYGYRYDQLNRITGMVASKGLNIPHNDWNPVILDDYAETVSYDPNGNILGYNRAGAPEKSMPAGMDSLTYHYYSGTNRLHYVDDIVSAGNYADDIDDQSSGNYTYDAIGNLKTDAAAGITRIGWTVYGKIDTIEKSGDDIYYTYDAAGNRIMKKAGNKTTVYVRDASGNVLSVYERPPLERIRQSEVHLYGSSRLGILGELTTAPSTVTLEGNYGTAQLSAFTRGEKFFELSNHLGNVLATITDKKLQHPDGSGGIDYYVADIATANDYYPFGMGMPGRKYAADDLYRYGFNGQERSTEIDPNGNSMTAEFWQYDARIGRRWNVDPRPTSDISVYAAFANNPIYNADPFGDTTLPGADGKPREMGQGATRYRYETFDGSVYELPGTELRVQPMSGSLKTIYAGPFTYRAMYGAVSGSFKGYFTDNGVSFDDVANNAPPPLIPRAIRHNFLYYAQPYLNNYFVRRTNIGTAVGAVYDVVDAGVITARTLSSSYKYNVTDLAGNPTTFEQRYMSGVSTLSIPMTMGLTSELSVASATTGKQSLVQVNRTAGNLFRDQLATGLRAEGRIVETEVFKRTPFGKRFVDLDVWHNGVNLGGIEAKVGSSRYHTLQRLKDDWLRANGYPINVVRKPVNW